MIGRYVFWEMSITDFTSGLTVSMRMGDDAQTCCDVEPCPRCNNTRAVHFAHPHRWGCRGCGLPREIVTT